MNTSSARWFRAAAVLAVLVLVSSFALAQAKRPLTHRDFDAWRDIVTPTLSADGKFLVYGLFPQEGDGEIVVRNLLTKAEWRQPAGERPEPPPVNQAELGPEAGQPQARNISIAFAPDGSYVAVSTFAKHADVAAAKKARKRPDQMPKGGMVIVNLATGEAVRVDRVKSFATPEKSGAVLAYLREPDEAPAGRGATEGRSEEGAPEAGAGTAVPGAGPGPGSEPAGGAPRGRGDRPEFGSELVLRDLSNGGERTLADVLEYSLSKDGALLVYAVSSRKSPETNGVYIVETRSGGAPRPLLAGKGKYRRVTWDEDQTQIAFLSDKDDAASRSPRLKLYGWQRAAAAPVELVSSADPGFRDKCVISDRGAISFSRDGKHVFFGCAPAAAEEKPVDLPDDDKVSVDLWHYKDDYIQPMQKVRAEVERTRTFRCVYHFAEKKMVQLADRTMPELTPSDDGLWGIGGDDREYRRMIEYDTRYVDSYLVNTLTGERKLLARKHIGQVAWSPSGKYTLYYNGKDWITAAVPDGKLTTLTANLGVNFWREDNDTPELPPPYARANWTRDGKWVLLYDEFDVWRVAPDGSSAKNITLGAGRKTHTEFRWVRLNNDPRDPDSRWVDGSKPLTLKAVNKDSRDQGFFRTTLDATDPPKQLIMTAHAYGAPTQAKNADVVMVTEASFTQFPDVKITDPAFSKLETVTNANPEKAQFTWGSEELIHYRNADGVLLSGILFKPENFDPGKKYPLLVYIYEKLSQNFHDFITPRPTHRINTTFFVSNGYLVLMPDIVYTIGQPGQSALKCVLPAIDAVVARGFVDEKAIGIQGHSWGGYQIAYMITQTNRFRAVAAGAPVSNMTSAYDGIRWGPGLPRQFQYEHSQSRIGGTLWERPMLFVENSPVFWADRVRTPILMLHNDSDDAVPWYQGIEYYLALRRLGKEVYMFTYNGEPHGLRRRPNQKDYTVRLQQFFDYYLKGAPKPDWMEKGIPYLDRDQEKLRLHEATGAY
ncbi:MAG TPA: prolyl oligopeptidase family serine peptidase [Terriglobales bacterium]|nr:prolyl oligopeptidase family serine peptidase [Terriglobales bacterium]